MVKKEFGRWEDGEKAFQAESMYPKKPSVGDVNAQNIINAKHGMTAIELERQTGELLNIMIKI